VLIPEGGSKALPLLHQRSLRRETLLDKTKLLEEVKKSPFNLRTLNKTGGSKYLAIGTIIPETFDRVKVYYMPIDGKTCLLVLEQIT